ncbi:MAG: helix-turn-helix domain-containing protein [Ruminococcaceae bacterium]|nr:helix-turn-helix domain-containing protein [Oscillospiraceae bacterium]
MRQPTADFELSLSIDLEEMRAEIMLDYLNETPRGIRASSYQSHDHSIDELYFIQSGSLSMELNGERVTLHEGDLLLIAPKTLHRIAECSDDVQRFNIRFALYAAENLFPAERRPWIHYRPSDAERMELAFTAGILRRKWENIYPLEFCRIKAYYVIFLSRVLEKLIPRCGDVMPERQNHLVRRVRIDNFFYNRIHEHVTLSDLARELSYSPAQTSRILKEYYGMGFTEKLRRARLARAEQMLAAGASRKEIAAACGYTTRQGFDAFLRSGGLL